MNVREIEANILAAKSEDAMRLAYAIRRIAEVQYLAVDMVELARDELRAALAVVTER